MQAVIMAGGRGIRLASVTKDVIPKPMVPLAGKPLLLWQIQELKRNAVTDIVIITGHLGQKIEEYFKDGTEYGVNISYIRETVPLGTAGAFYYLRKQLLGRYFLLVYGDVYFSIDIGKMERFHLAHGSKATLFVHPNEHPKDSDLVVLDEKDRVVRIVSKHREDDEPLENCVNAGFYIFDRAVCECVKEAGKKDLEKDILMPLIEQPGYAGCVYGYRSSEYIKDIGTVERIAQAEKDISFKRREDKNGLYSTD